MPEQGLDDLLDHARSDLLREIRLPELAQVRARAERIRRHRSRLTAGVTALALLLVVGLGAALVNVRASTPDPATSPDATGTLWRGSGLTLLGLDGPVLDQPGNLVDVQFADADRGYALSAECWGAGGPCFAALAATVDAGRTWVNWPLPFGTVPAPGSAALIAVGDGLVVRPGAGDSAWFGHYGQPQWTPVTLGGPPTDRIPGRARLTVEPGDCGGSLTVWRTDGTAARLSGAPDMIACQATYSGGAWWVGGRTADGTEPAIAVTRDGGGSWQVSPLPAGDGVARASARGSRVYASVVAPRGGNPFPETQTVSAVYLSVDSGPFTSYVAEPGTLIGEVVPLLDGRLVAAGPDWQVSVGGGSWERAGGSLPWVYRLADTPGGWVAYDLFHQGWAAVSYDGETWQKINVR